MKRVAETGVGGGLDLSKVDPALVAAIRQHLQSSKSEL